MIRSFLTHLQHMGLIVGSALVIAGCAAVGLSSSDPAPTDRQTACFPIEQLDESDRALADTLMQEALDHQALYTIVGGLKPMSTLRQERFNLARPDSLTHGDPEIVTTDEALAELERAGQLHRVADALSCGAISAVVAPFEATREQERTVQMLIVNERSMDETLEEHAAFWGQWGFTPSAAPGTVITTVEYEARNDRHRGYGYLFGYPEHAVSFFVEADRTAQDTEEFVERDFFHIPTYQEDTNRFTYAVPEGYVPAETDSTLYRSATDILDAYRERRDDYLRPDSTLRGVDLLRDWFEEDPALDPRQPAE